MSIANTIALITSYSTKAWDKVYKAEAMSSLLDGNENQVKWTSAKTVKIAKFQAGGLGNYYRNNNGDPRVNFANNIQGYQRSSAGLVWEEFTVKYDRGASYPIELFDNEETDGLALGAATSEISRTIMIPEIDSLCFSKIADTVADFGMANYCVDALDDSDDKCGYNALNKGLVYMQEHEVNADKQIIFASPRFLNLLRMNNMGLSRLLQSDVKDVKFTMEKYEGRDLAIVPPERFKTKISLDGFGVQWEPTSQYIDFMIVSKEAVMHVTKYNKVKIIGGDANLAGQQFDGWTIYARVYHDVFIPDNKIPGIYVHVSGGDNMVSSTKDNVIGIVVKDGKVEKLTHLPAEKLVTFSYKTATKSTHEYTATGSAKVLEVGTTLANGSYVVYATDVVASAYSQGNAEFAKIAITVANGVATVDGEATFK